ncbi:MAG: lipopolysaccharide kinase InaA family protein [Candidatus Sumerlaeia bacterium]|nr:lipopolysaccharide kinase InaA family protein [Candidatus Sumerlaeia bacterium]
MEREPCRYQSEKRADRRTYRRTYRLGRACPLTPAVRASILKTGVPKMDGGENRTEMTAARAGKIHAVPYRCGRLRGLCVPEYRSFDLTVIPWNDLRTRSDPMHQLVKASRTRCVVRLNYTPEGQPTRVVYAKRVLVRDLRKRLGSLFTPSKAKHEWQAAHRLLALGIETARPVVCAELRTGPWHYANFLVTEALADARPLAKDLQDLGGGEARVGRLVQLAGWLWTVHRRGFYHDDCSAQHVFVRTELPSRPTFAFIDLDNCRFHRATVPWSRRVKNLFQLLRSLPASSASRAERECFVRAYLESSGEMNRYDAAVAALHRLACAKESEIHL